VPSAFSHALVGASLTSFLPRRSRPVWAPLALACLAAAPDLDVVAFGLGIPYGHALGHRGLTHSVFFAAFVGAASLPFWRRAVPDRAGLGAILTFGAVASHGFLDTFTDSGLGVGLLIPLDERRFFAPWRPILTSPLSASAFLSTRAVPILINETVWVGIPTALLLLVIATARRAARKTPADP
jgi:inner membrane protein